MYINSALYSLPMQVSAIARNGSGFWSLSESLPIAQDHKDMCKQQRGAYAAHTALEYACGLHRDSFACCRFDEARLDWFSRWR